MLFRSGAVIVNATLANTTGLTAAGNKVVLNAVSGVNSSTTDFDACLVMEYIIDESANPGSL